MWASFALEDHFGAMECMVFSTQYERLLNELKEDQAVMIRASALPEEGASTRLSVQDIIPLAVARVALPSLISIRVRVNGTGGPDKAEALHQLFERKRGEAEVRLRIERPRDFSVILDVSDRVRRTRNLRQRLRRFAVLKRSKFWRANSAARTSCLPAKCLIGGQDGVAKLKGSLVAITRFSGNCAHNNVVYVRVNCGF